MKHFPSSLTKQKTSVILEQIDTSIYKIKNINKKLGIGFFCYINYQQIKIPVLITSYQIINEQYLSNNHNIVVENNNINIQIEFGKTKYLNKDYDLTIIEIKNEKTKNINFINIDEDILKGGLYTNETIYVIHLNKQKKKCVSYGIVNDINKFSKIFFSCNVEPDFACGAPIFNLANNKLIGVYKKFSRYFNEGIFFKFIINEFTKEYRKSRTETKFKKNVDSFNEINILINVGKEEVGKNIYFLDNYKYKDEKGDTHNNLIELNESNTELFIDNKKENFNKYFIPEEDKDYNIKIKFNINLTDCSYMFAGCENITSINFISFNTKYITNMKKMFYECTNLKNINLLYFNTEKVTNMSSMFYRCHKIEILDLSSFDTKNVIDMSYMFFCCKKLNKINLSGFSTNNVKDMSYMFFNCWNLENKDSLLNNISAKSTKMFSNIWDFDKLSSFSIDKICNKNEIDILINIEKEHINKEIYFLNNEGLLELNHPNTELFINNTLKKVNIANVLSLEKKENIL